MHAWYLATPFASSPLARASEGCGLSRALWQIRAIWCPLEPPPPSITFHLLIGYAQARHAPALPLPRAAAARPAPILSSSCHPVPTEGRRPCGVRGIPRSGGATVGCARRVAERIPRAERRAL